MQTWIVQTAIYSLAIMLLSGCVTEQSYVDSNQQVRTLDFDKQEAAKSRLLLGLGYLHSNNYPQAKFNLDKALEFAPKRADVHYSLAYYYQKVGNKALAHSSYLKSLEINPSNPDTLNNFGVFLCESGDHHQAIPYFEQAIAIPTYTQVAESYENMALCVLKANDFSRALQYLQFSYQHNPARTSTVLNLVSLHYAMGKTPQGLALYNRHFSNATATSSSLLLAISLHTALANVDKANAYQQQLKSQFPLSQESLLISAGLLTQSVYEQRKSRYVLLQKNNKNTPNQFGRVAQPNIKTAYKQSVISSPAGELLPGQANQQTASVHSVVGIGKNLDLPKEIIISQQSDDTELEIIERIPTLDINVDSVEIPQYKVQYGENLYRVSLKFNIQISTLMKWNKLKSQQINTGDRLYVQNPDVFHIVKQTKKLSQIADDLAIPLNKLMAWNKVKHDGLVTVGTKILKLEVE